MLHMYYTIVSTKSATPVELFMIRNRPARRCLRATAFYRLRNARARRWNQTHKTVLRTKRIHSYATAIGMVETAFPHAVSSRDRSVVRRKRKRGFPRVSTTRPWRGKTVNAKERHVAVRRAQTFGRRAAVFFNFFSAPSTNVPRVPVAVDDRARARALDRSRYVLKRGNGFTRNHKYLFCGLNK